MFCIIFCSSTLRNEQPLDEVSVAPHNLIIERLSIYIRPRWELAKGLTFFEPPQPLYLPTKYSMSSTYLNYDRYSTDAFLADSWTRTAWASVFALFTLWGLTWFLRHIFGQADDVGFNQGPYSVKRTGVDPELGNTGGPGMTTTDNNAYNTTGTGAYNNTTGTGAYNTTGTGVGTTGTGVGTTGTGIGSTGTTGNNAYNTTGTNAYNTTGTTGTTGTTAYNDDPSRLGGGLNATLQNIFVSVVKACVDIDCG
jgi:hypothetical protein